MNRFFSLNLYLAGSVGKYEFKEFVDNGNDYSGNKLTGVPSNKINAGILLNTNLGIYLSADYQFVDEIPMNDSNTAFSDSYAIANLKTGYRFEILHNLNTNFAFGINNLTNEKYASLILPNALPVGTSSPRYYYPGLPVNYYGMISLNYLF